MLPIKRRILVSPLFCLAVYLNDVGLLVYYDLSKDYSIIDVKSPIIFKHNKDLNTNNIVFLLKLKVFDPGNPFLVDSYIFKFSL